MSMQELGLLLDKIKKVRSLKYIVVVVLMMI